MSKNAIFSFLLNIFVFVLYTIVYISKQINLPKNYIIFSMLIMISMLFTFLEYKKVSPILMGRVKLVPLIIAVIWLFRYVLLH